MSQTIKSPLDATRRRLLLALVLVVATLGAYVPAMQAGFVWDDNDYVSENPLLRMPDGLAHIWTPVWAADEADAALHTPQYYPAVFTMFWFEYWLWGDDPTGYHLVNILLHLANALLLWRVMTMLHIPGGTIAAWAVAAIFALHPVHVESVAWITERKNVLSAFFYLIAAVCYFRFERRRDDRHAPESESWAWYAVSLALFLLALFSKTVTCSLPAALLLVMLWRRERITWRRVWPLVPFFAVGLALALNTAWYETHIVGAAGPEFERGLLERLIVACRALLFYPWKMIFPWPLVFIYPRWEAVPASVLDWWPCAVVGAATLGLVTAFFRGWRGPGLAAAFYAGSILPALGFADVYPHRYSFVADHFNYLPSIGLIALAVGGVAWIAARYRASMGVLRARRALGAAIAVVLTCLGALTFNHCFVYENMRTLFEHVIRHNPDSWMAHTNLAKLLMDRGRPMLRAGDVEHGRAILQNARDHLERALDARPHHDTAHFNLAIVLWELGELDAAYEHAVAAVEGRERTNPARPLVRHLYFAGSLAQLRGDDDAMQHWYERALEVDPHHADANVNLGLHLAETGDLDAARAALDRALERTPGEAETLISAAVLSRRVGRDAQAKSLLERAFALAMERDQRDRQFEAQYRLAWLLATSEDPDVRNPALAVRIARPLVEATGRGSVDALDALAAAYAGVGEFDEAVRIADEAIRRAGEFGADGLAEEIRQRRSLYRERRPYRE